MDKYEYSIHISQYLCMFNKQMGVAQFKIAWGSSWMVITIHSFVTQLGYRRICCIYTQHHAARPQVIGDISWCMIGQEMAIWILEWCIKHIAMKLKWIQLLKTIHIWKGPLDPNRLSLNVEHVWSFNTGFLIMDVYEEIEGIILQLSLFKENLVA